MPDANRSPISIQGNPGQSAYQIAQSQGFTGTIAQWLASLQGSTGVIGKGFTNRGAWTVQTTYNPGDYVFDAGSVGGTSAWLVKNTVSFISTTNPKNDSTNWLECLPIGGVPNTRNVNTQFSLTGGGALSADLTLNLVGDVASPGNSMVYGTNSSGVRGWQAGGSGVPGGSNTQLQYNNSGAFGGVAVTTYNGASVTQQVLTKYNLVDPTDTTKIFNFDASNIATATTRTVNIPNANSTTAQPIAQTASKWLNSMSAQGVFTGSQPAFSDLAGSLAASQFPALTGDVTNTAGSLSTTVGAIQNKSITLATGYLKYTGSAWTFDNSTFLTGNQTITLSGDVTGSGATAITTTIATNAVTYGKMQAMSTTSRLLGSNAISTAIGEISLSPNLSISGGSVLSIVSVPPFTQNDEGTFTIPDTGRLLQPNRLTLSGTERITEQGTARIVISDVINALPNKQYSSTGSFQVLPGEVVVQNGRLSLLGNARVTTLGNARIAFLDNNVPQVMSGPSKLLGSSSTSNSIVEIVLGTNLSMSGNTMNATGGGGGTVVFSNPGGRLTTESGNPVSTTDRTAQGTLYYTPYRHNNIYTWSGSAWQALTFAEISLALTVTSGSNYDVFINSAANALSLSNPWTNNTTRADALATQNGVWVLSSDHTKLWLGTIRADGTNTIADSAGGGTSQVGGKRYVWNTYNQVPRRMAVTDTTASWSYVTATTRQANAATGNKVEYVTGDIATQVDALVQVTAYVWNNVSATVIVGVGVDSTTVTTGFVGQGFSGATSAGTGTYLPVHGRFIGTPGLGYHFLSWLESGADNNCTFIGGGASGFNATLNN